MAKKSEAKKDTSEKTPSEEKTATPSEKGAEENILDSPEIAERKALADEDFGGLFGDERPSEAELMGEEKKEDETPSTDEKEKESATPSESKEEEEKEEETEEKEQEKEEAKPKEKEEKPEEKEEEKEEKPPKGYVPQQALKEARADIKALKAEIAELKSAKTAPPPSAEDNKWKDFKVLSDEDYNKLIEDDPQEALKYDRKFRKYEKYIEQKDAVQREQRDLQKKVDSLVDEWTGNIEKAIPGIYDEESDIASGLAEFAEEHGFDDPYYLEAMTDPRTIIAPPGQNQTYILGPGAAAFLKLLSNLKEKTASQSEVTPEQKKEIQKEMEKSITEKLEPKIREKVTKELTAKFKAGEAENYKSITEVPGSEAAPDKLGKVYTEAEWAKLSQEERDKLLGG